MTRPRLEACYFGSVSSPQMEWPRLARVLHATASHHCPAWSVRVSCVTPALRTSALGVPSHAVNTQKMDEWHRIVMAANDGDRLLLIDADTMIVRPIDDVWDREFDLAYTSKRHTKFPFNSGVVFLRVSDRVREFVSAWQRENARMLEHCCPSGRACLDPGCHSRWRARYGGINQAALGWMLEQSQTYGVQLAELPCAEWNCEDASWDEFDLNRTRILHLKGLLRRVVFGRQDPTNDRVRWLAHYWRQTEADCREAMPA